MFGFEVIYNQAVGVMQELINMFMFLHYVSECYSGYFGKNCEKMCEGCISSMCDRTTGLCKNTTGCEPGYLYGGYCNKSTYLLYILLLSITLGSVKLVIHQLV